MTVVSYVFGRACGLVEHMISGDDESSKHVYGSSNLKAVFFSPVRRNFDSSNESNISDIVHETTVGQLICALNFVKQFTYRSNETVNLWCSPKSHILACPPKETRGLGEMWGLSVGTEKCVAIT